MKLPSHSIEAHIARQIQAGQNMITDRLPAESARHVVSAIGRWWRSLGADHDADAIVDEGRCEVSGWTRNTPESAPVDWRVIILTIPANT